MRVPVPAQPMRQTVLYVESSPSEMVGGSHHSLLQLLRALDLQRYRPVVVFYRTNPLVREFESVGAEVTIAPAALTDGDGQLSAVPRWWRPLTGGQRLLREALFLQRVARRERARLIHLNDGVTTNRAGILAAALLGLPCVCHERKLRRYTALDRLLARRIHCLVAISDAVRQNCQSQGIGPARIERIYNALDAESVRPTVSPETARSRWQLSAGDPVIGIVGRVVDWKGQDTVIEATALLRHEFPDIRCLIIGDAPPGGEAFMERLHRRVQDLGLRAHVRFTGYLRHASDAVQVVDVLVHASTSPEPFGRVLLEGMAFSKPVIATDAGGPTEVVVAGETGLLVPLGEPERLSEAIAQLLRSSDDACRMGRAGRRRLEEEFSLAVHGERVQAVYRSMGLR